MLDLEALRRTPLARQPFDHVVVPDILAPTSIGCVLRDFPAIDHAGLVPPSEADCGPAVVALIDEMRLGGLSAAISDKFELDLAGRPLMISLRGRCAAKDGRIHTDSTSKLITALLYLNEPWRADGGRLRLLRGPHDIDDAAAEIEPSAGTFVAFRRGDRSYHGHKPFVGARRYLMLNWMTGGIAARRETLRHVVSARLKRWRGRRPLGAAASLGDTSV
ncbi:MAG TPA: 2OG-Fe(II) oxygenase [Candidatus Sulfotelmatobacter sp.]|nr:2OG-Fe(II) oxygenase [Candidatus Sulfotelmatobacter sp.]